MSADLSHVDSQGKARMVDISGKSATLRNAAAQGVVRMSPQARRAIEENGLAKGDVLAVARVAAIQAAKRVDELIPLCHTLPLTDLQIDFTFMEEGLQIVAQATANAQTGVEMEALTAVAVAALTVYDMAKAIDKAMIIGDIHLLRKTGGQSGDFLWSPSE